MRTERRRVQRKRPGGISYFEFEAGSGGIVLDASEKGLRFQAADAVHQLGPGRVWISPRPEERIELKGDVVWTDRSRKTGGLRFTDTGADGSRLIRNWLGQPGESEASPRFEESPRLAWAAHHVSDLRRETHHEVSFPHLPAATKVKNKVAEERAVEPRPIPGLPSLFTSSLPWQPQDSRTSEGRIAYRIATGFLAAVVVVAGVVLFDMFRPKVGDSLIRLGERINGNTKLQPQNPTPLPNATKVPAQPSPNAEAKPDAQHGEPPVKSEPPVDSSTHVNSERQDLAIPRAEEAEKRSPYRRSPNLSRDRSAEATRLWSAVALGDSSAEVDLARLYLKGEGVPRNCEQAKILLRAAAKSGSAEARQQLKKLHATGCR